MKARYRGLFLFSLLLSLSLLFTACQETTPPVETPQQADASTEGSTEAATEEVSEPASGEPSEAPSTEPLAVAEPAQGDVLRFAVLEDMTSTNVWALFDDADSSYWNHAVQGSYWPTLFKLSDQRYDFIPSLAADFPSELTEEGEFWVATVQLKEGLTWSDGSALTAEDVAFTANTALFFHLGLNWNSAYDPSYLDRVEATNEQTVKFYFNQKPGLSRWQYGALQGPIVSKTYWEPKVADAVELMTGVQDMDPSSDEYLARRSEAVELLQGLENTEEPIAGPFMFNRWEVGAFSENVVNPNDYFSGMQVEEYANGAYREFVEDQYDFSAYGEASGDKTLEFTVGPYFQSTLYSLYDQDAAILALRNNDVDFYLSPNGLSRGFLAQLQEDRAITTVENEQNGFRYMAFNHARPHLADPVLHQAVACMIDLEFLTEQLLQGQALPVYTAVPPANGFWYNPDVTRFCAGFDSQARMLEAVRLLKEAGYSWDAEPAWNEARGGSVDFGQGLMLPDGSPFPPIKLLAPSAGYDPLRATAGVFIEQYMRQLGIPVQAELTNFNNILTAAYETGEYDVFILGWTLPTFPDYICDLFVSGNPYNYTSAVLDEKCNAFYSEAEVEAARDLAFDIQEILATDLPYIYLFTTPVYDAYRNVTYPYTNILDGIGSGYYGFPAYAMPVNQ